MTALKGKALERLRAHDARERAKASPGGIDAERFWSLVDQSEIDTTCHNWMGPTKTNHPDRPHIKQYELGVVEKGSRKGAHRAAVELALNLPAPVDKELDIAPTCGNHLCCNLDHLVVRPNRAAQRIARSVPVREYYAALAVVQAKQDDLEASADLLLALFKPSGENHAAPT